ncbi:MAG: MarR family winged helix-turn-helix transcriptional regulator [Lachnospiraceae bacterium]|jgi:DNA-binding MarR family transcriptional regulator
MPDNPDITEKKKNHPGKGGQGRYGNPRKGRDFSGRHSRKKELIDLLHRCHRILFFNTMGRHRQGEVLRLLQDGPMTQKQVQDRLGIRPASISELVSKLEGRGQLTRERNEEDRRSVLLTLTKAGEGALRRIYDDQPAEPIKKLPLDDKEVDELIALLRKLLDGLNEGRREEGEE